MLVFSRKKNEGIVIGRDLRVVVLEIRGGRVKLGFEAAAKTPILRGEVHQRIVNPPPALAKAECA